MSFKSVDVVWQGFSDEPERVEQFAVNGDGEGLFSRRLDGTWQQHLGTGQFRARTPREMMRGLRHHYEDQIVRMVRGSADGWE